MAALTPPLTSLKMRVLSAAIAAAPAFANAESKLYPHQQWVCKHNGDASWQCQEKNSAPGTYPQPVKAPIKPGRQSHTDSKTNKLARNQAATPYNQWDWVPKSQLQDPTQCKTGCDGIYQAPAADWPDADQPPEGSALRASAASSTLVNEVVTLTGDVLISQGNRRIKADVASLNRNSNDAMIEGSIEAREPDLLLRAQRANLNTETGLGHFETATFLQHTNGIRGKAQLIQRSSETTLDMEQGTITQCTPDDEVWAIKASKIHLDNNEGWGSAKHARLKIKGVPVFYTPYMTFPIDKRRKSGFLFPTLGTGNDNGFEMTAPYYLNLAPNYDATIAPRYIEKRGLMTELELRQLSSYGSWVLAGAQLNDELYVETPESGKEEEVPPQENRWIGSLKHSGNLFGLSTNIDYSKVSDKDFFHDLSTDSLELKRTTHLSQRASLGYNSEQWQALLTVQDYQTIDDQLTSQYQFMPRFSVERNSSGDNFETNWLFQAEFTDFQHDDALDKGGTFVTGQRSFAETGLSYPMRWAPGFIVPSAKLRHVSYDLDAVQPGKDDSPSATAPLATLDMGLLFDRALRIGGDNYTQTLEPRLFYFYSEHEEQNHQTFDTRELNFGFSQLFRDTRFSGNDRLDDANQTSVGITSRFIDDSDGREVLTLSLGQIFYFEDRQVQLGNQNNNDSLSNSNIASEIQYQPYDRLWLSNSLLWDSRQDKLQEGGLGLHYQADNDSLYNLSYRFRRNGANNLSSGVSDLSQADASLALPLNQHWSLYARYRYDAEQHRSLDQMAGIQYEDCCWMLRLLYQQGIEGERRAELTDDIVVERDYAFILEFQLKELGSLGSKAIGLLEENILGYEDLD